MPKGLSIPVPQGTDFLRSVKQRTTSVSDLATEQEVGIIKQRE